MSDPNDVWKDSSATNGAPVEAYARESSPRRETRGDDARSPRRDRSRSPARAPERADRGRGDEPNTANQGNNLHVSGLSRAVTERQLEDLFSQIGKVAKVQIMVDPHSQESRGFGFVMMESREEAQAAIDQLSGQNVEGKSITVAHARRGRARTPTPGRYHGVKADSRPHHSSYDRPYQPRSYDSRYYDRPPPRAYDERDRYDRRDRYDDRRYDDRYARDRYDDYYRSSGGAPGFYHNGGVITSPNANGGTLEDLDVLISPDLPNSTFRSPLPLLVSLGARFSK
ncbi:hypothetical protein C345_02905 [Cryptococcus neoformans A2-102-5]|nr:hypothetical protein C368_00762 [Cryptococcus neoformans var. grubii 125.91]OXG50243.1 hypothetical protein C355_03208 [Cryptococcus neoformans var. grubii Th84]OXG82058.1 hypothetical protein C350_02952 [Cryptococcus neoformans var. grubii MW-RSA36]OXG88189.1 hypothetical protein C346_03031 [Cryptococcus neoformans var. grubii D17-1]OXG96814.1 hypothetical protein C345_02905 [Cryptococcus neoformans var. grubii A2-102-5]OXH32448.1 hypothetical protein J009_03008 [Cryptococcus neoformans va